MFFGLRVAAQQPAQLCYTFNETTVVKDSTGFQYPYEIWQKLLIGGKYRIRPVLNTEVDAEFLIYELASSETATRIESLPKPIETTSFKTGNKLSNFKFTDIKGNKFNLKELAGKVVVLNFWFINCAPCRMEIPELNKMVSKYKNNPNVVFLAVSLDFKSEIRDFLKKSPFLYNIMDNGEWLAKSYNVNAYPTHVVIDRSAKILFHSTGLAQNTIYWVDKSIEEALKDARLALE